MWILLLLLLGSFCFVCCCCCCYICCDSVLCTPCVRAVAAGSHHVRRRRVGLYGAHGVLQGIILRKQMLVLLSDEHKDTVLCGDRCGDALN